MTTVLFIAYCLSGQLPAPVAEYRFTMLRRWRFDFAWPQQMVALEVEGGVWTRGRHTRGSGFVKDMEKYNHAAADGWRVLRVTPQQLMTEETLTLVRRCLSHKASQLTAETNQRAQDCCE
jgi:very-short-patch-repair endonuclease